LLTIDNLRQFKMKTYLLIDTLQECQLPKESVRITGVKIIGT